MNLKEIKGYEGFYSVTDDGRVYSHRSEKFLSPGSTTNGYLMVMLSINGESATKRVHRLVAEAFVDNPHDKPEVNHLDSNRKNNKASNLEWVTRRENLQHCVETRDVIDGENNYNANHSNHEAIVMRYMFHELKWDQIKIAEVFNAHYNVVYQIVRGKRYKKTVSYSQEELHGCLYRFFDENEIIINICFALSEAWYYNIDTDVSFCTANDDTFKSRTEAETAAFTKAFEILEEKL